VSDQRKPSEGEHPVVERTRFLWNASLNFVAQAVSLLIGLASLPVVVRGLGPQRFALFSLALLVLGNTTLLDIGLGRATTKLLAEGRYRTTDDDAAATFWTSLALHAALGLVGAVVLLIATPTLIHKVLHIAPVLDREAKLSFVIVATAIPLVLVGSCLRGALEALLRFDVVNAVKVPASALLYLAPVVLILGGYSLVAMMVATWLSRAVIAVAYGVALAKTWPGLRHVTMNRSLVGALVSFGGWVSVANVSGAVLGYADRFVIGAVLSLTAVGYYSAPSDAVSRLFIVPTSVVVALFPAFSGLARDRKQDLLNVFGLGVKVLVFLLAPIASVLIAFAPAVLRIWFGADYEVQGLVVFDILLVGAFVNSLGWVPYAFLQACGRPDLTAKVLLYEMPFFALLLWVSVSTYGINGAAASWGLRVTGEVIAFFWLAKRMEPAVLDRLRPVMALSTVGQVALALAVVLTRAGVLRRPAVMSSLVVALGVVAFVTVSWHHLFDESEREALAGFLAYRSSSR
jgi:O-antigen/teichoic acid export membrane protein